MSDQVFFWNFYLKAFGHQILESGTHQSVLSHVAHSTAAKRRFCSAPRRSGDLEREGAVSVTREVRNKLCDTDVTLGINRKHKFSFSVTRKCWCGCLMRGNYHRSGGAPHSKHAPHHQHQARASLCSLKLPFI